jgi:hypothetical protein
MKTNHQRGFVALAHTSPLYSAEKQWFKREEKRRDRHVIAKVMIREQFLDHALEMQEKADGDNLCDCPRCSSFVPRENYYDSFGEDHIPIPSIFDPFQDDGFDDYLNSLFTEEDTYDF